MITALIIVGYLLTVPVAAAVVYNSVKYDDGYTQGFDRDSLPISITLGMVWPGTLAGWIAYGIFRHPFLWTLRLLKSHEERKRLPRARTVKE